MTHRQSLDVQLSAALLDFAPKYMKDQLEHLAYECDSRLEREFLPRLHALLRQVDEERDVFEKQKQDAARDLRDRLGLLRFDAAAVEQAIGQLDAIAPRHLALFPSASSLTLPVMASSLTSASYSASLSAPSTAASANDAFDDSPETVSDSQAASSLSLESAPDASNQEASDSMTEPNLTNPSSLDYAIQSFIAAKSSADTCSPKRTKTDPSTEDDPPCKRQRTADEKVCAAIELVISSMHLTSFVDVSRTGERAQTKGSDCVSQSNDRRYGQSSLPFLVQSLEVPDAHRNDSFDLRVAANLRSRIECIFRHASLKGYFVIRCDYCESGIFTKPPLKYDRALKHFQAHSTISGETELTNDSIFERYARQGIFFSHFAL